VRHRRWVVAALAGTMVLGVAGGALAAGFDFGVRRDRDLANNSKRLFGFDKPVAASSPESIDAATAEAKPTKLVKLAKGLEAEVVSSRPELGANTDMMVLWPNDEDPTHLITCNESGATVPGVQRISLYTGSVATIVTGTVACDGIEATAWGSIIFSEEAGSAGQAYELVAPLETTGVTLDRATGTFSGGAGAANLVRLDSLNRLSYEGLGLLPSGVLYYGDEQRPGSGTPGGAYFKFTPADPWTEADGPISDLSESPFASGKVQGLRLGLRSGATDWGQGSQTGQGVWVEVCDDAGATPCANLDLRATAAALKLTGYYRPEDLEADPIAVANGQATVCGPNTGIEEFSNFGEVICLTDGTLDEALSGTGAPEVQYLAMGTPQFAMPDNIAPQPGTGNWIVHEDGDQLQGNNDIFSCLRDGADDDLLSDGCLRFLTLNDLTAETTGGVFDATGKHFYVSIQHNITGHGVVLDVTGWKV